MVKDLEQTLSLLEKRVSNLEERIAKLDPFILYYRPPGGDHMKLNLALDELYGKINKLEDIFYDHGK